MSHPLHPEVGVCCLTLHRTSLAQVDPKSNSVWGTLLQLMCSLCTQSTCVYVFVCGTRLCDLLNCLFMVNLLKERLIKLFYVKWNNQRATCYRPDLKECWRVGKQFCVKLGHWSTQPQREFALLRSFTHHWQATYSHQSAFMHRCTWAAVNMCKRQASV